MAMNWTLCGCVVGRKSGSFVILEEHKIYCALFLVSETPPGALCPALEHSAQTCTKSREWPQKWSECWSTSLGRHRAATVQPAEGFKVLSKPNISVTLWEVSIKIQNMMNKKKRIHKSVSLLQNSPLLSKTFLLSRTNFHRIIYVLCFLCASLQTLKSIMSRNHQTQIGEDYATAYHGWINIVWPGHVLVKVTLISLMTFLADPSTLQWLQVCTHLVAGQSAGWFSIPSFHSLSEAPLPSICCAQLQQNPLLQCYSASCFLWLDTAAEIPH